MRHDGTKLRSLIKEKGYDLVTLANVLKVTTAAISKDLQSEAVSRRSLIKYVPKILDTVDEFYLEVSINETKVSESTVEGSRVLYFKDEMLAAKDEIIKEQREHIKTLSQNLETLSRMLRFFPKAAQRVTATT